MRKLLFLSFCLFLLPLYGGATRLVEIRSLDRDYIVLHFRDGEVRYRDDGTGKSAFLGHTFVEGDDTLKTFLPRFNPASVQDEWTVICREDPDFGPSGKAATAVFRRSKPMNTDHTLTSELDHWIYLRLPHAMKQGYTYEVLVPSSSGSDRPRGRVTFDIWNSPSEAIHVNILGYTSGQGTNTADLYYWLGDGGPRDYKGFEGNRVWLYRLDTGDRIPAAQVAFWKPQEASSAEAGRKDLTGSPVWKLDFARAVPGRYRLVVDGVGCSMDFVVDPELYREPYRYSVRGYYYMRIGEPADPEHVWPVPRQPRFQDNDPEGFKVYLSELQPWHPDWRKNRGDVWDEPHFKKAEASSFYQHRPEGYPVNDKVTGGHSDAMDWDRHLAHVSNIYDMILPYLLTGGRLAEDDLGIRESGNGIPDLLDEARNEVDFFLSIRDPEGGYSQGVTNPDRDWRMMFQAGSTTMAAWANAANCAILADAFRIGGNDALRDYYRDQAVTAFRYAEKQEWDQLDDRQAVGEWQLRGRDFKQMAAAYLYNVTGDRKWEDIAAAEAVFPLVQGAWTNAHCQFWAAVAYVICPRERHHASWYDGILADVAAQADRQHLLPSLERPSRRSASDNRWITNENVQLLILAHYLCRDASRAAQLERALYDEAGWGLGRNPANIVEMTGLGQRHITDVYSPGRNDGDPGTFPGQTPFNGTETWSRGDGGDARILLDRCYPSWDTGGWPRQESFFNQRYMWVNSEFTPRETMRGKMALLAYLYGIR